MGKFIATTKYDKNHNPIMTSLYDLNLINSVKDCIEEKHFLIAVNGYKNTDEMIKIWKAK